MDYPKLVYVMRQTVVSLCAETQRTMGSMWRLFVNMHVIDVIVDPDVNKYVDQLLEELESKFSYNRQHVWEREQSLGKYFI